VARAIRLATSADVPTLVRHRTEMFRDMGLGPQASLDEMGRRFAPWVAPLIEAGEYRAWLVEDDGVVIAGADVWLKPTQPGLRSPLNVVPYVLNVYTAPAVRRQGIARELLHLILEWAEQEGHPGVELHASDEGRPLYESLGFTQTNEMRFLRSSP
jgi:GNAT superfamily N-acetyltransferase